MLCRDYYDNYDRTSYESELKKVMMNTFYIVPLFSRRNLECMTRQEKEEIKLKVISEIEKTTSSIADYKEITKPISPENAIGRISRMDAINNKSVAEAALRQAENKLKNLDDVLNSIDDKGFGLCAKCQKPIPIGRILLMPQSKFCVNCAR